METKKPFSRALNSLFEESKNSLNSWFLHELASNPSSLKENFLCGLRKSPDYEEVANIVKAYLMAYQGDHTLCFKYLAALFTDDEKWLKSNNFTFESVTGVIGGCFRTGNDLLAESTDLFQNYCRCLARFIRKFVLCNNSLIKESNDSFDSKKGIQGKLSNDITALKEGLAANFLAMEIGNQLHPARLTNYGPMKEFVLCKLFQSSTFKLPAEKLIRLFAGGHRIWHD